MWLHRDEHVTDRGELFRSARRFSVWAYTVSHSQLLLRSRLHHPAGNSPTRIDLLFKPIDAMKIRTDYDGLVIRCAFGSER